MQFVRDAGCFSRAGRDGYLHAQDKSAYQVQTLRDISFR